MTLKCCKSSVVIGLEAVVALRAYKGSLEEYFPWIRVSAMLERLMLLLNYQEALSLHEACKWIVCHCYQSRKKVALLIRTEMRVSLKRSEMSRQPCGVRQKAS